MNKGGAMKPRFSEEFCRARFDEYLKGLAIFPTIVWRCGDEPPDYYLDCGSETFSVEVTALMEDIQVGSIVLQEPAIEKSLAFFIKNVEKYVYTNGLLNGTYLVSFGHPIENFISVKNVIFQRLVDYITTTQGEPTFPECEVFHEKRRQTITIEKIQNQKNSLICGGTTRSKWEGEMRNDLIKIMNASFAEKVYKLRKLQGGIILLLYDGYGFADPIDYIDVIPQLNNMIAFHTIFVAYGNGWSFVLYSGDRRFLPVL
jgi:hypothetical protein